MLSLCMQNTLCSSVTRHKTHTSSLNSDVLNFPFHKLCSGSFKELFSMHRVHKLADKSKPHCEKDFWRACHFFLSLTPSAFRSLSAFGTLPLVVISARTWAFHSLNVKWHQLDIKLLFNLSLLPRLEDSHSIHQAGATELKYC